MTRLLAQAPLPRTVPGAGVLSALTVDVEDYFQVSGFEAVVPRDRWHAYPSRVEHNTHRLLALLEEAGVRGTFFVLGWTAEHYPALVRRIQRAGHELGCHSYAHRLVYSLTPEEFRRDTRRALAAVEDASGVRVQGYRAPSFSITRKSLWALDVLAEEGFRYDSSIYPILRDRYGIPGAPRHPFRVSVAAGRRGASLLEVPPSTVRCLGLNLPVGGGGYLRLVPAPLFRWALARLIEGERRPAVLYVHPWELDPEQPRIPAGSRLSRFRQYVNLERTAPRLRALLARWAFAPLCEVLDSLPPAPALTLDALAR